MTEKKTVLILGAASDVGLALAHKYAAEGFDLLLAARDCRRLDDDITDLKIRHGGDVQAVEFDVCKTAEHTGFWNALPCIPLGVICVVGYLGDQTRAEKDFDEAKRILETNLAGPVSILNLAAGQLENTGAGFIIGISSVAGDRGRKKNYIYGCAKAGFSTYLSGLRNRLNDRGVQVLTVKPGFIYTRMTEGMELPALLTASPEEVANDIYTAWRKGKDVIYTKWFWRIIMLIIRLVPETVFKKTDI